ncbi:MAG: radical SAM protein [Smithellaceae bacterium]
MACGVESYTSDTWIGNFSDQTLDECLNGPSAQRLKQSLARGRLPLLSCVVCRSLRCCPSGEAEQHEKEHGVPRRDLLVENTVRCNIDCQDCPRLREVKLRKKMTLSDEDMEKISREVSRLGLEQISFLAAGEPFLPRNVLEQIKILRQHNPIARIVTSTNGTMLDSDEKREAALLLDEVMFSIHGCSEASVARYQRKGSFEKAYNNMKDLVAFRNAREQASPIIEWKYVLFNWNDRREMIMKAVQLAEEAGIDRIIFWPTTRPLMGISWRWYFGQFLRQFGNRALKGLGREVAFPSSYKFPARNGG